MQCDELRPWLRGVDIPTFLFVCLFALSSWIDINGVWVEVPLLVNELPESWNLPSYIVIIIQIANVGPLVYTVARKIAPDHVTEPPVVYLIISIGCVACLLLVFFWDDTTIVGGVEHSTALLTLIGFLSLVDCTSSVVYLPFMAGFRAQYIMAEYVGEGLSGLVPALLGLAQGVGRDPVCRNESAPGQDGNSTMDDSFQVVAYYDPPYFSVSVFFGILCCLLCVSAASFTVVNLHPRCRRQRLVDVSSSSATADLDGAVVFGASTAADDAVLTAVSAASINHVEAADHSAEGMTQCAGDGQESKKPVAQCHNAAYEPDDLYIDIGNDKGGKPSVSFVEPATGSTEERCASKDDRKQLHEALSRISESADVDGGGVDGGVVAGTGRTISCITVRDFRLSDSDKESSVDELECSSKGDDAGDNKSQRSKRDARFITLLLIVGWSCALTNGVLPSLQSYSCLPYGNMAYNLSVRLSVAVNPVACFVALFVQARSLLALLVLAGLGTVLAGYHVALAALSPTPPLQDSDAGMALAITTFVLLTAFFSYVKVCCASLLNNSWGSGGLLWCGGSTQIGSLIGAVTTFLLVNVFKLFTSAYPCT